MLLSPLFETRALLLNRICLFFFYKQLRFLFHSFCNNHPQISISDWFCQVNANIRRFEVLNCTLCKALSGGVRVCELVWFSIYALLLLYCCLGIGSSRQVGGLAQIKCKDLSFVILLFVLIKEIGLALAFRINKDNNVGKWLNVHFTAFYQTCHCNLFNHLCFLFV